VGAGRHTSCVSVHGMSGLCSAEGNSFVLVGGEERSLGSRRCKHLRGFPDLRRPSSLKQGRSRGGCVC
jgi:hypothetical protein